MTFGINNALHLAIMLGKHQFVNGLLEAGADANSVASFGVTPLHKAVMCPTLDPDEREELMTTLIESGAKVNQMSDAGLTPLHWAAIEGDLESIALLLDRGADIYCRCGVNAYTPLQLAFKKGQMEAVYFLISRGADKEDLASA